MSAATIAAEEARRVLVSEIGSERATADAGGRLVTQGGKTHIVWQDSTDEGYMNRVRTFDHTTGELSEPFTLNRGKDNHARPVITIDKQGFLHVVLSGHNSPVKYRRSLKPNDASAWTKAEPAGAGTYPVVVCGDDGTLYLTLRSASGWNGMDFYVKKKDGKWQQPQKLVKRDPRLPGYAGFAAGTAWNPDRKTMHVVVDFYESLGVYDQRGVHQAVCYFRSDDFGQSWKRADGGEVKLPARPDQLDVLARDVGKRQEPMPPPVILAQGNIAVAEGKPHVLYVSHLVTPGQIVHATLDERGAWRQKPVDVLEKRFPKLRPMGCRGALTVDEQGTLYALLELAPLGEGWANGKPLRRKETGEDKGKRLAWLVSRDAGKTFTVAAALDEGLVFHQANVERPTGFNTLAGGRFPPFIYFDGRAQKDRPGHVVQNNVYLVLPK